MGIVLRELLDRCKTPFILVPSSSILTPRAAGQAIEAAERRTTKARTARLNIVVSLPTLGPLSFPKIISERTGDAAQPGDAARGMARSNLGDTRGSHDHSMIGSTENKQ